MLRGQTLTFTVDGKTRVVLHTGRPVAAGDRAIVKVNAAKHSTAAALQTHPAAQLIDQGTAL